MSEIKITAEPRTDFGKGYARRIRAVGDIPAVIYGNGKEPKHVTLPGHETTLAVRNKDVVLVIEVTVSSSRLACRIFSVTRSAPNCSTSTCCSSTKVR